jgi:Tol biopolymer transport system component
MKRRAFIAGVGAGVLAGSARAEESLWKRRRIDFRSYSKESPLAPVQCVTPDDGAYIHTFFDVRPFSPSQRYLAVLRLPFENRKPVYGDTADVCVVDLTERTIQTVYRTRAFGMQTGAQVQWGRTDRYLYFNDLSDRHGGHAVCVQLDWQTGKSRLLGGPVYHVAPDEEHVASFNLDLINHVQDGYGCVVAPKNRLKLPAGASDNQGLWLTDVKSGKTRLLVSMAQIFDALPDKDQYRGLAFYLFHTKYSPDGSRIMQVVRARDPESEEGKYRKGILITMKADGSDVRVAVPPELWAKGGHHPNWHPNGDDIFMNLRPEPGPMRFHLFRYDGSNLRKVSDDIVGSGHPAFERTGRYIFTDAYPGEPVARDDGFVPMRLIDTRKNTEKTVAWIYTLGDGLAVLRLDPHPAWSRDGSKSCFNGAPDKRRQVFVADLSGLMRENT